MRRFVPVLGLGLLTLGGVVAGPTYNSDVRPILSAKCFQCHGPDEAERKAKTRLDVRGGADLKELVARITTDDPEEIMPPPDSNRSLEPKEVEVLKQWVADGARYEEHWAFVKPAKPQVPKGTHPVDYFVSRKLEEAGVSPAKRADAFTLIRRLSLDLIGLPPAPEAADAFASDPSGAAYMKLVDGMLASDQYGERWARRWLDLARYADTNGYEKDRNRSIWPYRDWVIRAINADMPFDRFTVEQIAGDMLPDATPDQVVATGFHRNTMLNEEGGIDPLEFRYHAMTDRVNTTGTVWLGLTTGCAQCHTHKYDPITQTDYFGIMAYLNNADEPDYRIPDEAVETQYRRNLKEAARLISELPGKWPLKQVEGQKLETAPETMEEAFAKWMETQRTTAVEWQPMVPDKMSANVPYLEHEGGGVIFAGGDTSKHDIYTIHYPALNGPVRSLRLEALPDERLPDGGPGSTYYEGQKGDFFLTELLVRTDDQNHQIEDASETYSNNKFGNNPVSAALATDGDLQTGWSVANGIGQRHVAVFNLVSAIPAGEAITLEMHFGRHFASSLGKLRLSAAPTHSVATKLSGDTERLLIKAETTPDEKKILQRAFLMQAPQLAEHTKRIRELRKRPVGTQTLVMKERSADHPRKTHRHHRGEYTQPEEEVLPRLPEALFPNGKAYPKNRLEFARWLGSRDNPLTARVVANRHWAAFFGTGIVETVDDFGMQGRLPTHPLLLDHLAVFLHDNNWSIKALHKHIVTSETYRRSSFRGSDAHVSDSLLAYFPRQRLEAEIIRDSALAATGILHLKMYGPPVKPPQPDGVTETAYGGGKWNASTGADRYRRSIYTYQKRTAPFAMFTTFDAGSGEACLAKRDRSNTPLQALTLMNDPMFIEIAEEFGLSIESIEGDAKTRIIAAFRRLLTRVPTEGELSALTSFYSKHPNWAALTRALLSLDETVNKN